MKNSELWIAPLLAVLLTTGCSKGVNPPEPEAAKKPEEKVYTTKDVEKLAAEPTPSPSPSPEAVPEPAEVREPAPSPPPAPRATAVVESVPGQYTNADLDKLPPIGSLPPPVEGGTPATDVQEAQEAQAGNTSPEAATVYTNKDLKELPAPPPTDPPPR